MIRLEWGEQDANEIRERRDQLIRERACFAGFDPGEHGAAVWRIPRGPIEGALIGDERRGTWEDAAREMHRAQVRMVFVEAQYAPRFQPGGYPSAFSAQAASAMQVAGNAGLVLGKLSGLGDQGAELIVVRAAPAVWQSFGPEIKGRVSKDERKELAIEYAEQHIPAILALIPRKLDRSGAADAWGLLDWGMMANLRWSSR